MSGEMWEKDYWPALFLIGCTFVAMLVGAIAESIFYVTELKSLSFAIESGLAVTLGQVYVQKHRQPIPKNLRLWNSVFHATASIWIMAGYIFLMDLRVPEPFPWINTLGSLTLLRFVMVYWALGYGAKTYLKKIRK
jgi:hypothetical protein